MGDGHVCHQAIDVCRGGRQTSNSLDRGQSRVQCTSDVEGPFHPWPHSAMALTRSSLASLLMLKNGGRHETVTLDRLKPHLWLTPVMSAAPLVR
jgi:hypothetical protein